MRNLFDQVVDDFGRIKRIYLCRGCTSGAQFRSTKQKKHMQGLAGAEKVGGAAISVYAWAGL